MNLRTIAATGLALSTLTSALIADSTLGERSTRLDSMELNNYMTEDGFNIFFNPANIAKNSSGAFLELGLNPNGGGNAQDSTSLVNGMAGVVLNGGIIGNFGVVLNRDNSAINNFSNKIDSRQNNLDLFYGIAPIKNLNIGMRISYASIDTEDSNASADLRVKNSATSYNQTNSDTTSYSDTLNSSDLTLQLGAQFIGIDATITYGMYSYAEDIVDRKKSVTYTDTTLSNTLSSVFDSKDSASYSSDGASLFEIALAYTFEFNEQSMLRGYGVYSATDYSVKKGFTYSESTETKNTKQQKSSNRSEADSRNIDAILLGAAYNYKPTKKVLLVVAGEYSSLKDKTGYTANVNSDYIIDTNKAANTKNTTYNTTGPQNMPDDVTTTVNDIAVYLAAEALATEDLTLRFGLRESIFHHVTDDYSDVEYNTSYFDDNADTDGAETSTSTTQSIKDATSSKKEYYNKQGDMQVAIGFGYAVTKSIDIDGLVNANLFLTGPNFISGERLTDVNARLALNYNF